MCEINQTSLSLLNDNKQAEMARCWSKIFILMTPLIHAARLFQVLLQSLLPSKVPITNSAGVLLTLLVDGLLVANEVH